jgi:hypothetical protein
MIDLLVRRLVVDDDSDLPVAFRHRAGRVLDEDRSAAGQIDAIGLACFDLERDEADAALLIPRAREAGAEARTD